MPVEKRSYGQESTSVPALKETQKPGLLERIRYAFDNAVANTSAFLSFLLIGSAALAVVMTFVSYGNGSDPQQDARWTTRLVFWDRLWFVFTQIVFGGGKPDGTNLDRFIATVLFAGNVIFSSFLFAFVTVKIFEVLAKIQRGRASVIDSNHTLILGWSNRLFPLLSELNIASSGKRSTVVVLSPKTRTEVEVEIASRCGKLSNLKVITRTGDIENPADLSRVKVALAKSVVVLDSDSSSDALAVSSVLAIQAAGAIGLPIVVEMDSPKISKSLRQVTKNQVIPVRSDDVIARVTAQASRQTGLATVVLDLLDFAGDEIYFTNVPALTGKTYRDALLGFNNSSVIGIVQGGTEAKLNPAGSRVLSSEDRLIVIAEDDTKVAYTGTRDDLLKRVAKNIPSVAAKPANLLIIGWSFMGDAVLAELAGFLPKGSTVDVVVHDDLVSADTFKGKKWGSLKVTHKAVSGDIDELVAVTKGQKFDEIIVLGYRKNISLADADAHTMLTMLQLNQLNLTSKTGEPTRLIAEILDSRKAGLARVAAEGDLVISDNLGALLIAQLSENPALASVFEDLFSAGGASILIKPVQNYVANGKQVTFADLVAAAADHGESAIGYRKASHASTDGSTGVKLNPSKTESISIEPGDSLVVIGNL